MIEAALAAAGGRVSGPACSAASLGIPPSTLESKIRSLKISKHRFKPLYRLLATTARSPIDHLGFIFREISKSHEDS